MEWKINNGVERRAFSALSLSFHTLVAFLIFSIFLLSPAEQNNYKDKRRRSRRQRLQSFFGSSNHRRYAPSRCTGADERKYLMVHYG